MTRQLVKYEGKDIFFENIDDVIHDVSFDDGKTWRVLSEQERNDGFEVSLGKPFVARVSKSGLWPVVQKLVVKEINPNAYQLDNVGPKDIGSHSFFCMNNESNFYHIFYARLTLFREASQDRIDRGVAMIPQYLHDILAFDGVDVLSNKQGSTGGFQRFDAHINVNVPSYGKNGNLIFAKTPDETKVPRLIAVFVPNGLNLTEAVPVHIFLTPHTGNKKGEYPYTNDWNALVDNYLVGGGKRMINQHVASRKRCVFVFPVAAPDQYFTGIQAAARLRQYLLEMVYFLQRNKTRFPDPKLLHCAVSGFSYSGNVLLQIMRTSQGSEFPELHECYGLDLANVDVNDFLNVAYSWWGGGNRGRYVRFYSQTSSWSSHWHSLSQLPERIFIDGAKEYQGKKATFVLTPLKFWQTVYDEEISKNKNKNPAEACHGYFKNKPNFHSLHQVMPSVFMEHALKNSGFHDM